MKKEDRYIKKLETEIKKLKRNQMWHKLLYHPVHYIVRRKMNEILPDPQEK